LNIKHNNKVVLITVFFSIAISIVASLFINGGSNDHDFEGDNLVDIDREKLDFTNVTTPILIGPQELNSINNNLKIVSIEVKKSSDVANDLKKRLNKVTNELKGNK